MAQRRQAQEWSWASLPASRPMPAGKRGKPGAMMLFVVGGVRGVVVVRGRRRARRVRKRGVSGVVAGGSMVVWVAWLLGGIGDGLGGWASGRE